MILDLQENINRKIEKIDYPSAGFAGRWIVDFKDLSIDKNPGQIRREVLVKKLQACIATLLPDHQVWVRKATATVLINKRPLVSVRVQDEDSAELTSWVDAKVALYQFDKAAIISHFASIVSDGSYS